MAGVGGGADDAAVTSAEGFQVGGGIDVGHRRDLLVGIEHFGQLAPGALDIGEIGHVGHRATGGEIGQNRNLVGACQDIRHLGHEMHAAEDDVFGIELAA